MQELGKFNFKINIIPNGSEKHMSFNINNKLIFIGRFEFLSFSLDSLVKNLGKDDFKYLSREFDSKVLDSAFKIRLGSRQMPKLLPRHIFGFQYLPWQKNCRGN